MTSSGKDELREQLADLRFNDDPSVDGSLGGNMEPEYFDALLDFIIESNQQAVQKALEGLLEQKHDMVECEPDDNWKGWTAGKYPMQAVPVSAIKSALAAVQPHKERKGDDHA